ncbi:MAG TPA: hemolysin family protein [Acidimicrobiales bacterium]|nr:hemolysin family protein [Acidimicrobiales bacterium]
MIRRRRDKPLPARPAPTEHEREILAALEALRATTVREVMTPRVDVVALSAPASLSDVTKAIKESGHSRFPVYEDDLDRLAGVLFVKDLFRMGEDLGEDAIARRLRQPFVVLESKLALDVLQEMRQSRNAFAVVVDEYGGVEGVLTVKDLVSELVGDLPDEFDREGDDDEMTRVDSSRWLLGGACPVDRLQDELDVPIPEGDYVTVGGFLFSRFGRIPDEGDRLHHGGWEFKVAEMDKRRIARVVLHAPSATIDEPVSEPATGK